MIFNGKRLRKARYYNGLSVDDLASKIGIKKQSISQFETGKSNPSTETLWAICRELHFPINYFFQSDEGFDNEIAGTTYFRSMFSTSKKYRQEQIVKMEHVAAIYSFLSKYIVFPKINLPQISECTPPQEAAKILRKHWNLGNGPICDLIQIMERNGIITTSFKTTSDSIDAFSHKYGDLFIVVLSQNKDVAARSYFDAAHELGHIVLHDWYEDIEELSREEFRQREKEANQFAASFLCPEDSFNHDFHSLRGNSLDTYVILKNKWHMSIEALLYHANQLGAITPAQYQYSYRALHKKGWYRNEPYDDKISLQPPTLFKSAIELLLKENIFSTTSLMQNLENYGCAMEYSQVETLLGLPEGMLAPEKTYSSNIIPIRLQSNDQDKG